MKSYEIRSAIWIGFAVVGVILLAMGGDSESMIIGSLIMSKLTLMHKQ